MVIAVPIAISRAIWDMVVVESYATLLSHPNWSLHLLTE